MSPDLFGIVNILHSKTEEESAKKINGNLGRKKDE